MKKMRNLLRKAFTSVTILVVPHDGLKALNLKVPMAGLALMILLAIIGGGYTLGLAVNGLALRAQHNEMAEKVKFYSGQFNQWNSTMAGLKVVETQFRRLFSLGSKEEVLESVDTTSIGSLGVPTRIPELRKAIETVDEIREYLREQKDIYVATPRGYPVEGDISSRYGKRKDPFTGETVIHTGVDVSCNAKAPILATADGVVGHAGWTENSGYLVILEHGCGYTTVYAHNNSNSVKIGQKVKRGDPIGYVGSTGRATGPHVHYEVWKDGKTVDAERFLHGRS